MTCQLSTPTGFPAERRWVRGILGGTAGFFGASLALLEAVGPAAVYNDQLQSPKLSNE